MPTKQNDHDLEPLLTAHQNQLGLTMAEADSIDGKALALLAIIVALLIFIAQAGLDINIWQALLLIVPQCLALVFIGLATWPRHYSGSSVDLDEHPEYLYMDKETLVLQLLSDADDSIKNDTGLNKIRWRHCMWSIVFMLLGTIPLFVIL